MTIAIEHSLKFVTEFQEGHPVTEQILALDEFSRMELLEGMLKQLVAPALESTINKINENGTYAILKVVK
jgi:hypothetical protein